MQIWFVFNLFLSLQQTSRAIIILGTNQAKWWSSNFLLSPPTFFMNFLIFPLPLMSCSPSLSCLLAWCSAGAEKGSIESLSLNLNISVKVCAALCECWRRRVGRGWGKFFSLPRCSFIITAKFFASRFLAWLMGKGGKRWSKQFLPAEVA